MEERILKEKLKISVDIDEKFKKELLNDLVEQNSSKLNTSKKMKVSIFKRVIWGTAFLSTLIMAGIASYFVINTYNPYFFRTNKDDIAKAEVFRGHLLLNGDVQSFKNVYLTAGDVLKAGDNSFIKITSDGTDVYMDSNSQVAFNSLNGKLYPYVEYGKVVISSAKGNSEQIRGEVGGVDVLVTEGSVHAQQNIEKKFSNGYSFVKEAYAADIDPESVIIALSGEVIVKKGSQEVELTTGNEVVLKSGLLSNPYESDREALRSTFCNDVIDQEEDDDKDPGTLEDTTAPVITLIAPEDGTTVKTRKVTVKFSSNEDGWYYNGSWKELKAGDEISYSVSLKSGVNDVKIIVKDSYYNKSYKTIQVTYDSVEKIAWSEVPEARESGVYLKWYAVGAQAGDYYKLFRNGSLYKAIKVTSENINGDTFLDSSTVYGKTYKYEVKLRRDSFLADSTLVSVVAKTGGAPDTNDGACHLTLTKTASAMDEKVLAMVPSGDHYIKVSWSVSGDCPDSNGFKLVWNKTGNPVYPGDTYAYYSDTSTRSGIASGLTDGTWYVRVSLYIDGMGKYYSNQISGSF